MMQDFSHKNESDFDPGQTAYWKAQRDERGFDDTELWNLDSTVVDFVLPRLKAYREQTEVFPVKYSDLDEWRAVLDEIIEGLELYKSKIDWDVSDTVQGVFDFYSAKRRKAFKLLGENLQDMWM